MSNVIGFRATPDDERIINTAAFDGETKSDVIRRALYLLDRHARREQMWTDMQRVASILKRNNWHRERKRKRGAGQRRLWFPKAEQAS